MNYTLGIGRHTAVFLSRLDPDTKCDDIIEYARDNLKMSITCEKLQTKFDTYSSFKIDVTCIDPSTLLNCDKWPAGVLIRKFYVKKSS